MKFAIFGENDKSNCSAVVDVFNQSIIQERKIDWWIKKAQILPLHKGDKTD